MSCYLQSSPVDGFVGKVSVGCVVDLAGSIAAPPKPSAGLAWKVKGDVELAPGLEKLNPPESNPPTAEVVVVVAA